MEFIELKMNIDAAKVLGKVKGLMNRLANTKPAFKTIANFIRSRVLLHFKNQKGRTAGWQGLAPRTSGDIQRKTADKKSWNEIKKFAEGNIKKETTLKKNLTKIKGTNYLAGHKLLVNNGNLINSLQGGADSIFIYKDGMAVVGTNIDYAKYHEHPKYPNAPTNSFHEKKRIPKRDFMFVQAPDIAQIKDILDRFISSGRA
ncbi:MAG TPA: hypothetical protein PKK26_03815 [Candidatus Wallbacteria bacterium]|nr:hypothetical protein [Candidatus Wallbacteria bacterium]